MHTQFLRLLTMLPTLILGFYLVRFFTVAKTQWTINKEGIVMKWLRQFKGRKEDDLVLKWAEIKSHKDIFGKGYSIFKIILLNGKSLYFPHGGIFLRDDFDKFYETFQQMFIEKQKL